MNNESGTLVKKKEVVCPKCGAPVKYLSKPLSRVCTNDLCDYDEMPGEPLETPYERDGDHPDLEGYREGTLGGSPYGN